jgi:Tol biopolymer transport system component
MALPQGTRIGPYEIVAPLGAGGMGEVYRAHDAKLHRDVAIKILPEPFVGDADRVARFEREAKALAALSHPNIATIHGFEESPSTVSGQAGIKALVLELVEGPTLADRVAHGSIAATEALPIARQIALALEAAHARGIVHRDLKPWNVKVRPDGTVKILDFGLAKLQEAVAYGAGRSDAAEAARDEGALLSNSPTVAAAGTHAGVVLGTAAYMSPEQARGRPVDKRADIWAFGCVLFEMLTATQAFSASDLTGTLAAVITQEPTWNALPPSTPSSIRRVLRRCLEKDPDKRLHDIADARIEIDEALADGEPSLPVAVRPAARRERLAWLAAITLFLALVAAVLVIVTRPRFAEPPVTRLDVTTPPTADPISFALAPDGRQLVFVATADTTSKLWLRRFDQTAAQPLAGTDDASFPFWSPDSRSIGFFAGGKLKRVDASGSVPQVLADAPAGRGGTWNADGVIVFAPMNVGGLMRVAATGGAPALATQSTLSANSHRWPQFLPDGRHFLLLVGLGDPSSRGVFVASVDDGRLQRVLDQETAAFFAPPHWLLSARQGQLTARRFDPVRLTLSGDPVLVEPNVGADPAGFLAAFSVAPTGVVALRGTAASRRQLVWFDRRGNQLATAGSPDENAMSAPAISPSGGQIAMYRTIEGNSDIWLIDVARQFSSKMTFDPATDGSPVWSADGRTIIFRSTRSGASDLYRTLANRSGSDQVFLATPENKSPLDVSRDGRHLLFTIQNAKSGVDLMAMSLTGDGKPFPVVQTNYDEVEGQFSPDGRWIVYVSNESGSNEVYAQPFPGPGDRVRVSTTGGAHPRWRRDGAEVFYVTPDNRLMAAAVRISEGSLDISAPAELFRVRFATGTNINLAAGLQRPQYAVASDGRFLVNVAVDDSTPRPIRVLINWPSTLPK